MPLRHDLNSRTCSFGLKSAHGSPIPRTLLLLSEPRAGVLRHVVRCVSADRATEWALCVGVAGAACSCDEGTVPACPTVWARGSGVAGDGWCCTGTRCRGYVTQHGCRVEMPTRGYSSICVVTQRSPRHPPSTLRGSPQRHLFSIFINGLDDSLEKGLYEVCR